MLAEFDHGEAAEHLHQDADSLAFGLIFEQRKLAVETSADDANLLTFFDFFLSGLEHHEAIFFSPADLANDAFMQSSRTRTIWAEQSKHASTPTGGPPAIADLNEKISRKESGDSPSAVLSESNFWEVDIEAGLLEFFDGEALTQRLRLDDGPKAAQDAGSRFALIALLMISFCRSFGN